MSTPPNQVVKDRKFTRLQTLGIVIFVISNIFCADEMVPGWETFHLGWPMSYYYVISTLGGAIGGALVGGRFIIPGLIGGAIAGPGALFAVGKYLASVEVSYSAVDCLCAIIGALPGILVGLALKVIQSHLTPDN